MNTSNEGLAKHTSSYTEEMEWENVKIVAREGGWTGQKFLERIESLRKKNKGIMPQNYFNQLEDWQSTSYPYF